MYAMVNAESVIVELLEEREDADGRWGHARELVELTREHSVGDSIDYGPDGVER